MMFLHNDEELFKDVIIAASVDQKRPVAIVEKDYYVTMILKLLAQVEPGCVFKGGTSLSKCHHVIDRFSEDIDITFSNTLTQKVMQVDELLPYLRENQETLIQEIRNGKYKPNPVRRVEIPKETKGEFRKLGVPTVVDRVVQQAIAQELSPIFEEQFSENSFGFRPKRGAHDALRQCQKNVNDGYVYVVDMDLEKFFDTVCQSKLIEVLSRTVKDGRVISLIHKYLNAGVVANGKFERTEVGMPQGGPLSPLLSNIMLNELDKELESRGHRFVRYADDCMIFCKSRKSAERTLENIIPFIEGKLFLKVNRKKTKVAHISKVKYLGYTYYRYKGTTKRN